MLIRNSYYEIIHIKTVQYPSRLFPLVVLGDGKLGVSINAFTNYLLTCNEQESSLHKKVRAICQLYEFCCRKHGTSDLTEEEIRSLIYDFGRSKLYGTIDSSGTDQLGLYWKPVKANTVKQLLQAINEFDSFQQSFFNAVSLNPLEVRFQSNYEKYLDFKQRKKYDFFLHLLPSSKHEVKLYTYSPKEHRGTKGNAPPKVFPADKVINLIDSTNNPRDKLLLLLLAFGGLRKSELLHLYHNDVLGRFNDTGAAWVVLGDPVRGEISYKNSIGKTISSTRQKFLDKEYKNVHLPVNHPLYKIKPRNLYSSQEKELYAGFKGMTFTATGTDNFIHWLHDEAGIYFWSVYQEYLQSCFYTQSSGWPYHPFLFIRVDNDGLGLPLTSAAIDKIFSRACHKIGLSGYTPHSMRHLYGYYLASVLSIPIEKAQVCLHHASINSTQVYYKTSPDVVRQDIQQAFMRGKNTLDSTQKNLLQKRKIIVIPDRWLKGDVKVGS